jgi:large subunit ribosomal protein L21
MKKAVIQSGGKQYLVEEGSVLLVDKIVDSKKTLTFEPLLVIDGEKSTVGTPHVAGVKVTAEVTEDVIKGDKVLAIRYKSKKRVRKVRGHRQQHSQIKIKNIA